MAGCVEGFDTIKLVRLVARNCDRQVQQDRHIEGVAAHTHTCHMCTVLLAAGAAEQSSCMGSTHIMCRAADQSKHGMS